jgi:hypothetical protein
LKKLLQIILGTKKYFLVIFFIMWLTPLLRSQWYWYNPLPNGSTLNDIWFFSSDDGWAVGDGGKILHFNGQQWNPVVSNTNRGLQGLWFTDPDNGWAVGNYGTILRYESGTWSSVVSNTTLNLKSVCFITPSNGWAVGDGFLHYDGSSWTTTDTIGYNGLTKVFFLDANHGWAGGDAKLYRYTPQGWLWYPFPGQDYFSVRSIFMLDSLNGWVGGCWTGDCVPYILEHPASGWTFSNVHPGISSTGLYFDTPSHGWACGYGEWFTMGAQSIWEFNNNTWINSYKPVNIPLNISGISASNFYVTLAYGHILFHDTTGFRFSNSIAEGTIDISFPDTAHGWAVGQGGEILNYSMGQWKADTLLPSMDFRFIHFADTNHGVAAGCLKSTSSNWFLYTHYDRKWHFIANGLGEINDVCAVNNGEAWATSGLFSTGLLYHVIGNSVTTQSFPEFESLWDLSFTDPEHGWIAGQTSDNKGLIYKYNSGNWILDYESPVICTITSISMANTNSGWAVGTDYNHTPRAWSYDGQQWTAQSGLPALLTRVLNPEPGLIYALSGNEVCTFMNNTWTSETLNLDGQYLSSISSPDHQTLWVGGEHGAILSTLSPFPVGVTDPGKSNNSTVVTVYPNPFTNHATISFTAYSAGSFDISLLDYTSRILKADKLVCSGPGKYLFEIPTEILVPGIYFCKLASKDRVMIVKLIKTR